MKINPNKVTSFYEAQSSSISKVKKDTVSENASSNKGDRIEISQKGLKHGEVLASKSVLANGVEKGARDEKILMLKDKIAKGEYYVSSSDIAEAILKTNS